MKYWLWHCIIAIEKYDQQRKKFQVFGFFYQEKVQYYDIATEKRAEFDKAMAEYKKRKVSSSALP